VSTSQNVLWHSWGVRAGWLIAYVDKCVGGRSNYVILFIAILSALMVSRSQYKAPYEWPVYILT